MAVRVRDSTHHYGICSLDGHARACQQLDAPKGCACDRCGWSLALLVEPTHVESVEAGMGRVTKQWKTSAGTHQHPFPRRCDRAQTLHRCDRGAEAAIAVLTTKQHAMRQWHDRKRIALYLHKDAVACIIGTIIVNLQGIMDDRDGR